MSKSGRISLAELLGSSAKKAQGGELTLDDLPNILGDKMPELPRNGVGRHRLTQALRQRFGPGYKNLKGVGTLVAQFDSEVNHEVTRLKLSQLLK